MQFNLRKMPDDVHYWLKVEAVIRKMNVGDLAVEVLAKHAEQFRKTQGGRK